MSISFSEFIKRLGAEPWSRDPETVRARNSAPELAAAAEQVESFERKLQGAVLVGPPPGMLDGIKRISQPTARRTSRVPLALAAGFLLTVGVVGTIWQQSRQWESVEAYLADHYAHDGGAVLAQAAPQVAEKHLVQIMAELNASTDRQLSSRIQFIKYCPTPGGRGAHMVVSTADGPVTVIFMPKAQVTDGEIVAFDQLQAVLVSLEHGSAAIIGKPSQGVGRLEAVVRESLKTGLVSA